jgi:protein-disulfide isomerase
VTIQRTASPVPAAPKVAATVAAFAAALVLVFVGTRFGLAHSDTPPASPVEQGVVVTAADGDPIATAGDFAAVAGIPQQGNRLGSAKAPVVLVEFEDPQCVACRQYELGVTDQVAAELVATGRLQVRRYPLTFIGAESTPAARWIYAAGQQGLMWQFTRAFHLNAGTENSGYVTTTYLRQIAGTVPGMDVDRAEGDAASPQAEAFLDGSRRLAARLQVTGTPWVMAGRSLDDLQTVHLSSSTDFAAVRQGTQLVAQDKPLPRSAGSTNTCAAAGASCGLR